MSRIKVGIFTGSRAEYGLLRNFIKAVIDDKYLELQLIVSGTHLSKRYGYTVSEIYQDGIEPALEIVLPLDEPKDSGMGALTSILISRLSIEYESLRPDIMIVLGDRYEAFGAATAAYLSKIPVAHIHGGEKTLGSLDDGLRHAITQLSDLHFTAADEYSRNILGMGKSQSTVVNVGPMILDRLVAGRPVSKEEFTRITGYVFDDRINLMVTYHSVTKQDDLGMNGFVNLLEAIQRLEWKVLFTSPNADVGGQELLEKLTMFVDKDRDRYTFMKSLGQELYLSALYSFDAIAGNSSSGIIEAPLIGIPVLNIGNRQKGRLRYGHVKDVSENIQDIQRGLVSVTVNCKREQRNIFDSDFVSPSQKIIRVIKEEFQ